MAANVAQAASQEAINACRQIKADAERLKCFDALAAPQPPAAESRWQIEEEKSALDDTPMIIASLRASSGKAVLGLRCKERKTAVFILDPAFIGCGAITVTYRMDQNKPVQAQWPAASNCRGVGSDSPIPFVRSLRDGSKLFVRLTDGNGTSHDSSFELTGIGEARARVAAACGWAKAGP